MADSEVKWQKLALRNYGIEINSAKAALQEAWRFVKSSTLDVRTLAPQIVINHKIVDSRLAKVIERNIAACLLWDSWNRDLVSIENRASALKNMGHDCTPKALTRAIVEDLGLAFS